MIITKRVGIEEWKKDKRQEQKKQIKERGEKTDKKTKEQLLAPKEALFMSKRNERGGDDKCCRTVFHG